MEDALSDLVVQAKVSFDFPTLNFLVLLAFKNY